MGTVNSGNKKVNSGNKKVNSDQNKKRFTSQQFRFIRKMFHGFVVSACPLDENMVLANKIFHLQPTSKHKSESGINSTKLFLGFLFHLFLHQGTRGC